jgi:GT2 family glycosyltransferase
MRRILFSKVGLFDEALPVCEDYDFWLRVSVRFPIYFINRKLIIKRGGHSDQLSNRSWGNDRYRVIALEKLLSDPSLSEEEGQLVLTEMKRKCEILAKGFLKRGNELEAKRFLDMMRQHGIA